MIQHYEVAESFIMFNYFDIHVLGLWMGAQKELMHMESLKIIMSNAKGGIESVEILYWTCLQSISAILNSWVTSLTKLQNAQH